MWTIPIEVKCYGLLGLLGVVGLLNCRWLITFLTTMTVAAYAVLEPRGDKMMAMMSLGPEQRFVLEFGLLFFAGVMFHKLDIEFSAKRQRWALALCLSGALLAYAFPVQQTFFWMYKDRLSWWMLLVLVSATTLGLAFASWHLVEKMALRLKAGLI